MIFLLTQMLCDFPTDGQFYIPIDPYIDNKGAIGLFKSLIKEHMDDA